MFPAGAHSPLFLVEVMLQGGLFASWHHFGLRTVQMDTRRRPAVVEKTIVGGPVRKWLEGQPFDGDGRTLTESASV